MGPAGDEAAPRFVADLVRLRRAAGMPSYSTLERLSDHRLSRSTMSDILTGKRVRLPEWRFVAAFVAACRAVAEENDLEPARLGTPADWKRRWDAAASGFTDVSFAEPVETERRPDHTPNAIPADEPVGAEPSPDRADRPVAALWWGPVPGRVQPFVGREAVLQDVRHRLTVPEGSGRIAVQGLGGVGKSQLAIAYADRFAGEYDLVVWVPSGNRAQAVSAMAKLVTTDAAGASPETRAATVVEALRLGRPHHRWLLVFDDANDPDEIRDLMPPGPGHIIVTTRNVRWSAFGELHELDVLPRAASVTFLLDRMRNLSEADAHRLADAAGDLPLVLEHSAESRRPIDEYLTLLATAPRRLLSENQPSGYPVPVTESWEASIERLRVEVPSALDLLHCCAFFGTDPIPLESIERVRYLTESSLYTTLLDPIVRSRAIAALGRTALARVNSAQRTIHVHRLVQGIVRDRLGVEDAVRSRHDVHLLLAAADPGDPDDFDNWPRYHELRSHMMASDMVSCRSPTVRQLVLNMVRYLRVVGEPEHADALADKALERWPATEAEDTDADALAMNLAINRCKVDALQALGKYTEAFELCRRTLARMHQMRPALGDEHPESVILGRSMGAELRVRGRFTEALAADRASLGVHLRVFDRDHPQTFMAVNNLAVDLALTGQYKEAIREDENVYRDCLTFYGRGSHPAVLFFRNAMARSMRQDGRYRAALASAQAVRDGYMSVIERGILSADHPWVLANAGDLAAARRDAGHATSEALASDVHNRCWRVFGVDHPQTLAVAVTLGTARRSAGRVNEAVETLTEAARRYAHRLGPDHPFTYACTASLAGAHRQSGDPERALALLDLALPGLRGTVGDDHHYTLGAVLTRGNARADLGDLDGAEADGQEALRGLRQVLGPDHPHTLACVGDVGLTLSGLGREDEAAAMRADALPRLQRALGEQHPDVALFLARRRLDLDFTPIPI